MGVQLQLARHQIADLKRIIDLGPQRLAAVQAKLAAISPPPLDPKGLLGAIRATVPEEYAEPLVRQLLSLRGVVRQSGESVVDVLAAVGNSLAAEIGDCTVDMKGWKVVEAGLKTLIDLECVRLAATAIELSYDYANLLQRTKILTDIRPLYDDSAKNIEGAVVSFTLRLRYSNANGEHDLSIALDERDIIGLSMDCDRALQKAKTARALMEKSSTVPVIISGEVPDA